MESARDIFLYGNYQCNAQVDFAKEGSEPEHVGETAELNRAVIYKTVKNCWELGRARKGGRMEERERGREKRAKSSCSLSLLALSLRRVICRPAPRLMVFLLKAHCNGSVSLSRRLLLFQMR